MGIAAENVTKRFGDFVALDDVSIEVPDGGLTALLGPGGSGKSTLLRVIAGLEEPDEGRVLINGQDNTKVRVQDRNVGFVFQHYAAFKHMTVYDNIAFGLKIRGEGKGKIRERVNQLLGLVHLKGFERATPTSSRAASASAWRSPGRSRWSPRCCCWTSPSARSTPRCARSCGPGCAASTTRST